jgi:hypothetical protein
VSERELFWSYRRGWTDGTAGHPKRPEYVHHASRRDIAEAYEQGYAAGQAARTQALYTAAERYGYTPTLLRAASEEPSSG